MTYDPYRQQTPQDPYENPYRVNEAENRNGNGVAMALGALLLAAIAGFVYFSTGDQPSVANNEMRPPITQSNDATRPAPRETSRRKTWPGRSRRRARGRASTWRNSSPLPAASGSAS